MLHTNTNTNRNATGNDTNRNATRNDTTNANEEVEEPEEKQFYDEETKTFDATRVKNGDIPFRKRVTLPEYSGVLGEAQLTLCKERLSEMVRKYKEGEPKPGINLTKEQKRGLKKLKKRIKDKEIVCFQTDKSGALSVDTPENYIESMKPHLEGTVESSEEEYEKTEKLLNAHMQNWGRIVKFGKRVTQNFITENNEIPPLYGLRKDHKIVPEGEEEKGPPPETSMRSRNCKQF